MQVSIDIENCKTPVLRYVCCIPHPPSCLRICIAKRQLQETFDNFRFVVNTLTNYGHRHFVSEKNIKL